MGTDSHEDTDIFTAAEAGGGGGDDEVLTEQNAAMPTIKEAPDAVEVQQYHFPASALVNNTTVTVTKNEDEDDYNDLESSRTHSETVDEFTVTTMNGSTVRLHAAADAARGGLRNRHQKPSPQPQSSNALGRMGGPPMARQKSLNSLLMGGFVELNDVRKFNEKAGASLENGKYETLDKLYTGAAAPVSFVRAQIIPQQARKKALRRITALLVVLFFGCFLTPSITFFVHGVADIELRYAMLYTAYTLTSSGFGVVTIPQTTSFFFFLVFFMFAGIAFVVCVAATLYLWVSMEYANIKLRGGTIPTSEGKSSNKERTKQSYMPHKIILACLESLSSAKWKISATVLSFVYLFTLWFGGALVLYFLEDWTYIKALYCGSYVLTTVGYGDMTPTTSAGVWFITFWLPFNVSFLSIYMGNLAKFFMRGSTAFTRYLYNKDMKAYSAAVRPNGLRVIADSIPSRSSKNTTDARSSDPSLRTMNDVLELVLGNASFLRDDCKKTPTMFAVANHLALPSPANTSSIFHFANARKPSFALQVLVQERLTTILVHEIAGIRSEVVEKDLTFHMTLERLEPCLEKWKFPHGTRQAFAMVAFEVMVYVGEQNLVLNGAKAILELSPFDCYRLFSPFLAACEDAGTMEGWLAVTEELAAPFATSEILEQIVPNPDFVGDKTDLVVVNEDVYENREDILLLSKLSAEYDHSLLDIQTFNRSLYRSNRILFWSLLSFMIVYGTLSTLGIILNTGMDANLAILFTLYTATSAGFGNVVIPKTQGFLIFAMVNLFIEISNLAMVIAQTVQYYLVEAVRQGHAQDKRITAIEGAKVLNRLIDHDKKYRRVRDVLREDLMNGLQMIPKSAGSEVEGPSTRTKQIKSFLTETGRGRAILVASILVILLLFGIVPFMLLEGWTFAKAFYFSTYALLTVGHGDVVPATSAGLWYLNCWMPFNVVFVPLYLGSVAHIYVLFIKMYTKRIEKKMLNDLETSLSAHRGNSERSIINTVEQQTQSPDLEEHLAPAFPATADGMGQSDGRRTRIRQNSSGMASSSDGAEIRLARQLLQKLNEPRPNDANGVHLLASAPILRPAPGVGGAEVILSPRYQAMLKNANVGDDFSLRLSVLDRLARIVAFHSRDIESVVEVDGGSFHVTIDSFKDWAKRWKIPHQAKAVFRLISFDAMLYVGQNRIITQGYNAFLQLSIIEFMELFSPFVFALHSPESMKKWLAETEQLAIDELFLGPDESGVDGAQYQSDPTSSDKRRHFLKNEIENFFPVNMGNVVRSMMYK